MSENNQSSNSEIVVQEPQKLDILKRLSDLTGTITAKTVEAWNIITTGEIPEKDIETRPGQGNIKYVSHVYAQRVMNEAFKWNWDFECLGYQVHDDGSVSSQCRLIIHMPLGIDNDGRPIWKTRVITEVGAFEMYKNKYGEATMNTADRVASSVSRGLVKCMERAFNIGSNIKEVEKKHTAGTAWRALETFGTNQGLTREEIVKIMEDAGITKDTLLDRFQDAYQLVYEKVKGISDAEVPLE